MNWCRTSSLLEDYMVEALLKSKKPMTINEITSYITKNHPDAFRGKTPRNSLYSVIYRKEKRRQERGEHLLFKKENRDSVSYYRVNKAALRQ